MAIHHRPAEHFRWHIADDHIRMTHADRDHPDEHFACARLVQREFFYRERRVDRTHNRRGRRTHRSEEHTYELQSLMRHPFAVFGLKKNNTATSNEKSTTHRSETVYTPEIHY